MPKSEIEVTANIKPEWLKIKLHSNQSYGQVAKIVREHELHTICESGMCPNRGECWSRRTATFMIMGEVCTRSCRFCATQTGKPLPLDECEPQRLAQSIKLMELKYAVITSVTRDDLTDGGANHWARAVECVRAENPETRIEVLIPDLDAKEDLLRVVAGAQPDIIGHNIECVERLTPSVRSRAKYRTSLQTLQLLSKLGATTKSGIMVGLGETQDEVLQCMDDLREVGCKILTIGQYLRPTLAHLPVEEYVTPEKFEWYKQQAMDRGFSYVASAPLVRSSYLADEALKFCTIKN